MTAAWAAMAGRGVDDDAAARCRRPAMVAGLSGWRADEPGLLLTAHHPDVRQPRDRRRRGGAAIQVSTRAAMSIWCSPAVQRAARATRCGRMIAGSPSGLSARTEMRWCTTSSSPHDDDRVTVRNGRRAPGVNGWAPGRRTPINGGVRRAPRTTVPTAWRTWMPRTVPPGWHHDELHPPRASCPAQHAERSTGFAHARGYSPAFTAVAPSIPGRPAEARTRRPRPFDQARRCDRRHGPPPVPRDRQCPDRPWSG